MPQIKDTAKVSGVVAAGMTRPAELLHPEQGRAHDAYDRLAAALPRHTHRVEWDSDGHIKLSSVLPKPIWRP